MTEGEKGKENSTKGKKNKPVAASFVSASEGFGALFHVQRPVEQPNTQSESEPVVQDTSEVEEKQESQQEEQRDEAQFEGSSFLPANLIHKSTASAVPHSESISSNQLAGQNVQNQSLAPYGRPASIPLKKSATQPAKPPKATPLPQQNSQVVERMVTKVTIEIYEDQRRAIEAAYIERVNALIDSGVPVDRRKYQESVIYRELLDFAIETLRKQRK
jgi:hypothetical protein